MSVIPGMSHWGPSSGKHAKGKAGREDNRGHAGCSGNGASGGRAQTRAPRGHPLRPLRATVPRFSVSGVGLDLAAILNQHALVSFQVMDSCPDSRRHHEQEIRDTRRRKGNRHRFNRRSSRAAVRQGLRQWRLGHYRGPSRQSCAYGTGIIRQTVCQRDIQQNLHDIKVWSLLDPKAQIFVGKRQATHSSLRSRLWPVPRRISSLSIRFPSRPR